MHEEDVEIPMKVLIVGNGAVGKSSMIRRYCKGEYTNDYKKTIGVDFLEKKLSLNGEDLRLMIWDTAGQEEFDAITKAYYRGAAGCVVAFSTTDRDSFDAVEKWISKVEAEVQSIPMVLVQNKIDLVDQAVVTKEEADSKASSVQLRFYRTSVQDNFGVNEVFSYLAEVYLKKMRDEEAEAALKALSISSTSKPEPTTKTSFQGQNAGIRLEPHGASGKTRTAKVKKSFLASCSVL
eukprot:m.30445 g.30445  ORF g.30445 m.30445 type:complete len:236 (-) comp16286_c0_seq2:202-909(-)